jgi:enamine deaminase RidA (YjgF/YER057c/UK114 family)
MRKVIVGAQGKSGRPLSGAVVANGLVFVSGQSYAEGKDVEEQTRGVLDKIAALLAEAGTDLTHAVRCTVFMSDLSLRDRMNAVYRTYPRARRWAATWALRPFSSRSTASLLCPTPHREPDGDREQPQ